ncbi:methyl-accepting chemotaxis protein [Propionivibrio limicola]|uniref:methyl-accepting chemotaxis protein n=1 Tax=Propionivibrio limicola TaxID=167645 RepID=UPI0012910EE5|nr:methyl-accepting chemotaxis protein [Propionivibrio limicola]
MKNVTIAQRILLLIATSVISLLLVGGAGLYVANKQAEGIKIIVEDSLTSIQTLGEARQMFMALRLSVYGHVMSTDPMTKLGVESMVNFNREEVEKFLKEYEKLLSNDEDKKLLEADVSSFKAYIDLVNNEVLPKSRQNDSSAGDMVITELSALGFKTLENLNAHMEFNRGNAEKYTQEAMQTSAQGKITSLIVIALGIAFAAGLGLFTLRSIKSSLSQIQSSVNLIERDLDFTVRARVAANDEIGQTTVSLNRLLDKLQNNLKSISQSAQSVATAAGQMASTSNQVATASHQQSEAASDMAATVEEMTVSVNHVADRALEADRISDESGQLAISGEKVIGQTVNDIQDIASTVHEAARLIQGLEEHSQQISKVVTVIKEVADQTNLLALNAAIEAARAGEQGRGFAVVADEVRKLAERTSSSTQEISTTIDAIRISAGDAVASMQGVVSKVSQGVDRAQEASESIKQIGEGSRHAVAMVEEIASAIREQGAATNNIATQVERIAQMSEESSAAATNSASVANDLDRLATDMQRIVSAYRL